VNEAVEQAHRNGILTATSLMVSGPAAADAVARARRMPALKVGLHLVLVDGVPTLPPGSIPDLIEHSGRFRSNMALSGLNLAVNGRARRQLAAEIAAQFEAFRATGIPLDHCNGHRHFHVHPLIARMVLRIGREFGLGSLRVPVEPAAVLRRIEPGAQVRGEWLLRQFARLLLRQVRELRLFAPDQVFGIRWSGAMTRNRMQALMQNLPAGVNEIYCHPAVSGGWPGSAANYNYREELQALTDPEVVAAAHSPGIRLGAFTDFMPPNVKKR
jgi:hopanoid biosynthesis associated protein HpnK